ncbi:hypothetical protein RND71_015694 [Anisodus tanguticus]|uniref:Uncharacterized protein n=1 Tax=Anisodus tanguticus TaxID=243964 RepID=A0AAE1S6P4_9SOLA|nr:hypothetical protein RND71_015694 [Anisodus tanguticus]
MVLETDGNIIAGNVFSQNMDDGAPLSEQVAISLLLCLSSESLLHLRHNKLQGSSFAAFKKSVNLTMLHTYDYAPMLFCAYKFQLHTEAYVRREGGHTLNTTIRSLNQLYVSNNNFLKAGHERMNSITEFPLLTLNTKNWEFFLKSGISHPLGRERGA